MAIPDALPYIQFFGQVALIAAAFFAGYQLLLHRRERKDLAAKDLLTSMQTQEFRSAYATIWALPLQADPEAVEAHGPDVEQAAVTVAMTFESIGVMVHNRIIPLEAVDQFIGGFLRESWRRLQPFIQEQRRRLGAPRYAEWYQWLAERVESDRRRRTVPAYEAFADWRE